MSRRLDLGAVTIRRASIHDAYRLRRLADLDSADLRGGDMLLAELGDELIAAVAIRDGAAIADPFRPTADLVELLRARAAQLRRAEASSRRRGLPAGWLARIRSRRAPAHAPAAD